MEKRLAASSILYRLYQVVLDAAVIFLLINIFGLVNSFIIAGIINVVKIATYYIYHKNIEKIWRNKNE